MKIVLFCFIIFGIYSLDQATKYLALTMLSPGESIPVIDNIFHLTLVFNTGAAFGIMKGMPLFSVAITLVSIVFIGYFLFFRTKDLPVLEVLSLCFIAGGALGNLTDRLRFSYVVDFFDFRVWPVFNVADSFITIGAVMLFITLILPKKKEL